MDKKTRFAGGSFSNWLGLGFLALLVVGLIFLSQDDQSPAGVEETRPTSWISEPQATSTLPLPTEPSSLPEPTAMTSPLAVDLNSPLSSTSPLPRPESEPSQIPGFELTLVHTNDTWGYLLACG